MKVEKVVTLKLREYLDGLAFKIADELKKLAQHNGRRTIQKADFDFVIEKFYVGDKNG
jgi:histone H3/H4